MAEERSRCNLPDLYRFWFELVDKQHSGEKMPEIRRLGSIGDWAAAGSVSPHLYCFLLEFLRSDPSQAPHKAEPEEYPWTSHRGSRSSPPSGVILHFTSPGLQGLQGPVRGLKRAPSPRDHGRLSCRNSMVRNSHIHPSRRPSLHGAWGLGHGATYSHALRHYIRWKFHKD